MKKNITINTLAMGNLRNRRKQYTIMILGIILAMIFSSGMIFFISSFLDSSLELQRNQMGMQTTIICDGRDNQELINGALNERIISEYGVGHVLGYSYHKEATTGTCIGWMDEEAMKLAYHKLEEGSLPEKEGEIAIEHTALLKLGYGKANVGDTIKLSTKIQDGRQYYKTKKETYTLTGILKDKKKRLQEYQGGENAYDDMLIAALVAPGTQVQAGGKEKLVYYAYADLDTVNLDNSLWNYYAQNSTEVVDMLVNYTELEAGNLFRSDEFLNNLPLLILVFVLAVTSCITIINAFATNLKDRRRQIGLLRAVGATRRQIVTIFLREALIIALVSLPISYFDFLWNGAFDYASSGK